MRGSPLQVNTFNENVLSGLGQKAASPGWLREMSWQPRFNQGSIGAWQNSNENGGVGNVGPIANGPQFNFTMPGGDFFVNPATSSGSTNVLGNIPIEVASNGGSPPTFTVSLSTQSTDYGSGSGSVGEAISTVVTNQLGGVGFDLLRISDEPSEIEMSSTTSTDITIKAFKYPCRQLILTTVDNAPTYLEVNVVGFFYDFYYKVSNDLIDNEPTTGGVATLTRRDYDTNTLVLGRKFNGGTGYETNSWFGAALPNFDVACS